MSICRTAHLTQYSAFEGLTSVPHDRLNFVRRIVSLAYLEAYIGPLPQPDPDDHERLAIAEFRPK